jgi:hypothetical protein
MNFNCSGSAIITVAYPSVKGSEGLAAIRFVSLLKHIGAALSLPSKAQLGAQKSPLAIP